MKAEGHCGMGGLNIEKIEITRYLKKKGETKRSKVNTNIPSCYHILP